MMGGIGVAEEVYDGEFVLCDLAAADGDVEATRRVLARFAVVRLLLRAVAGRAAGGTLASERADAAEYVRACAAGAERRTLDRVIELAAGPIGRPLCRALNDAADAASAHGAVGGAFALWRLGFVFALMFGWRDAAVRAAHGLGRLGDRERGGGCPEPCPSGFADRTRRG